MLKDAPFLRLKKGTAFFGFRLKVSLFLGVFWLKVGYTLPYVHALEAALRETAGAGLGGKKNI